MRLLSPLFHTLPYAGRKHGALRMDIADLFLVFGNYFFKKWEMKILLPVFKLARDIK